MSIKVVLNVASQKSITRDATVAVSNLYKRSFELNKRELFIEAFEKYVSDRTFKWFRTGK